MNLPKFKIYVQKEKRIADVVGINLTDGYAIYYSKDNPQSLHNEFIGDDNLMMSIGIKDKNGKDIFEGDIVEDEYCNKYVVKYTDVGSCGCCYTAFKGIGFAGENIDLDENDFFTPGRCDLNEVKIIGNIFDKGKNNANRK
jgi:uncharacterized phage protein (TIGR01671 family)